MNVDCRLCQHGVQSIEGDVFCREKSFTILVDRVALYPCDAYRSIAPPPPATSPDRDQLAAMAMQGLCADPNMALIDAPARERFARLAYGIADAMLAERKASA
jgi:hypothetical protein